MPQFEIRTFVTEIQTIEFPEFFTAKVPYRDNVSICHAGKDLVTVISEMSIDKQTADIFNIRHSDAEIEEITAEEFESAKKDFFASVN